MALSGIDCVVPACRDSIHSRLQSDEESETSQNCEDVASSKCAFFIFLKNLVTWDVVEYCVGCGCCGKVIIDISKVCRFGCKKVVYCGEFCRKRHAGKNHTADCRGPW